MTSLVAIRCSDGVVIGADSAATFANGQLRTIEQPTDHKICIIDGHVIVAGTGFVGHAQRFAQVVKSQWEAKAFQNKSGLEIAKLLSRKGIEDFMQTNVTTLEYSAFVAYPAQEGPVLCELLGGATKFQPELKLVDDLWYTSAGSGQIITDPLLALFRTVFWSDGAPNLQGGIFTAMWALKHACDVNPGGIKEPIHIAVLVRDKGKYVARMLEAEELQEHEDMVEEASKHMSSFRQILEGKKDAAEVPTR